MPPPQSVVDALRTLNPWWGEPTAPFPFAAPPEYRRAPFDSILARLVGGWRKLQLGGTDPAGRGILLFGLRRVGKSTITRQILESLRSQLALPGRAQPLTQVAYLNVDDARLRGAVTISDLLEAWQPFRDLQRPAIAVIDEVQHLDESEGKPWHRQLKGLVELENMLVLATGSSATVLRGGAAEAPGRWLVVKLEPMSFREFRELRAGGAGHVLDATRFLDLERYLSVGGFPELMRVESQQEAHEITRGRVRQVLDLEVTRSRQTDKLEHLHRVLVEYSGDSIDVANLSRSLGVSRPTAESWIGMLEQALLVQRLWRRGSSSLQELRGQPKVYAADPGIVAAFARVSSPVADPKVRSRLQEAAVLRHLREIAERAGVALHCLQRVRESRVDGETDFLLWSPGEAFLIEVATHAGVDRKSRQQLELGREVARIDTSVRVHAIVVHAGPEHVLEPVAREPLASFLENVLSDVAGDALEPLRRMSTKVAL